VLLLENTAPLFVPILAWLIIGANTPNKVKAGIFIGFIGVVIVLNPTTDIFKDLYSFLPLLAGLMIAFAIIYVRLIGKVNTPNQMFFYYFYITTVISGIFAVFQWKTPDSLEQWVLILGIGLNGLFYQVLATYSYLKAPVRLMSPIVFIQTVFGCVLDWIIWKNVPGITTIAGAILVITGGVITVYFGMHLIKKN